MTVEAQIKDIQTQVTALTGAIGTLGTAVQSISDAVAKIPTAAEPIDPSTIVKPITDAIAAIPVVDLAPAMADLETIKTGVASLVTELES